MTTALTVGGWFAQAAIQTSIDILSSLAIQQYKSYPDLNDALWSLNNSLSKANAILAVSHKMKTDEHLTQLLKQLKESVYDASDLLGELQYEELKLKMEGKGGQLSGLLTNAFESLSDLLKDAPGKVRKVQKRLDEIASAIEEVVNISLFVGEKQQSETAQGRDPTSSFLLDPEVFGRDEDLGMLTELLLKPDEGSQSSKKVVVPVISLVGMGGVGKTTLAQLAYSELKGEFEERIWICASDPFDVKRLTREIVETVDKDNSTLTKLDKLQEIVMRKLESKRFLVVIDDVWNEDWRKWETFYASLRYGALGSKILVTTRSLKVAETIKSMYKMLLEGLSEDDYYSFFKKCAFGYEDSKNYPKLEAIGKKIAGRLKGIPLAAKTLGSLLNSDLDEEHWKTVMASEIWDLKQDESDIMPVLKLSYDYLPPCLKQCFAYCSLFPKDFHFEKDTLVQMWMAQGFIITSQGKLMEDVGRGYVKDLLSRGLFGQYPFDYGKMMMHDLLHDLAQSISKDECHRIDDGKPQKIPCTIYHLSVCDPNLEPHMITDICNQHKKLRTLLFVRGATHDLFVELNQLLNGLTCMRVLELKVCCRTYELPGSIGNLKQLRYLDISGTNVHKLPESLCRLYNLQVLKLHTRDEVSFPKLSCLRHGLTYEVSFPKGVTNLINLRHLSAVEGSVITIADIGKLTSLQDLRLFSIRKEHGYMIEELKNMIELRGFLHIEHLENIDSKEEASKANLDNKMYLKELQLEWAYERHTDLGIEISDAVILEGLRPHPNLEDLKIVNYGGLKCPSWLESQFLSNLVSISLINCKHMVRLPPLGQLPYLKFLELRGLNAVNEVGEELYGTFPSLEMLDFSDMSELEWSGACCSHSFPRLVRVSIIGCRKLRNLPCLLPSLVSLHLHEVGLDALPGIWSGSDVDDVSRESSCSRRYQSASLSKVYVSKCPNLKSLEQWLLPNQLPDLHELTIANCGALTSLPIEKFKAFSSLKKLKLINMPELGEWSGAYGSHLFPCLVEVSIRCCPKLRNLPCLPPSLEALELHEVGLDALPGIWVGSDVDDDDDDSQESSSSSRYQSASLSEVSIHDCRNLKSLEGLLLRNRLTVLQDCCGALTSLPIERFKAFPSPLKKLELRNMPELEWSGVYGSHLFPCLVEVSIWCCPKLRNFPCLPHSLVKLELEEVGLVALPGIWVGSDVGDDDVSQESSSRSHYHQSASLSEVYIHRCPNLKSLDELLLSMRLPSLKTMSITDCGSLEKLLLPNQLPSLKTMSIKECGSLEELLLPNQLPDLRHMTISDCGKLTSLAIERFKDLSCLSYLMLTNCPKLTSAVEAGEVKNNKLLLFPSSLKRVELGSCGDLDRALLLCLRSATSLQALTLRGLTKLKTLESLQCFPSLITLSIRDCPQLKALPEDGLPISLRWLYISNCHPDLKERCQKDTGDDWPKIAHLRNIEIDGWELAWSDY